MKENFKLTDAGRYQAKWIMFQKMLWPFIIGEVVINTVILMIWSMSISGIAILATIAILMLAVFVKRTWNNENLNFRDWGLHIDEESVYLTEDPQSTEILRADVKKVEESDSGLIVKGQSFGKQIWIPAGVEGYFMVRQKLNSWVSKR